MLASIRLAALFLLFCAVPRTGALGDDLATQFSHPPASCRPWVYWFWSNGNVTKAGITADLEAMERAGIGGVIIMDVLERFAPPPGPADYMSEEWQKLVLFAVAEANRLGLEVNMTNGPGWCGSSGPWITPEMSMQKLVATVVDVQGPTHFSSALPRPEVGGGPRDAVLDSKVAFEDFYRDIAVLAVPADESAPVPVEAVINLTGQLQADGRLEWDAPDGKWQIFRVGHASTGMSTRPPVKGGNGLEVDKLSSQAMDLHFSRMLGPLITELGPLAGSTLTSTHIDSWEVGSQNWTPRFSEEFKQRRGYELTPYLPNLLSDQVQIGTGSTRDRFVWDFQRTRSELLVENYVGRLAELAHDHRLRLSVEGYHLPFGDEATYAAAADEPMTEFWAPDGAENEWKARQIASVAHTTGKPIVGAEAFTAGERDDWSYHPAMVKSLGDYQFCQGVNRFVIHRYAHQPYLDRFPGVTMGPWGLHYERTQTWWDMSAAWHKYLSRCQFMLRQGAFVADLCYLRPETPDQTAFMPAIFPPAGYRYDECSPDVLIENATASNGRVTFPDGMSYRVLVLPTDGTMMTPELANAIKRLVSEGVTVIGPRPASSPSMTGYPDCDTIVAEIGAEVWGECDGETVKEARYGNGRVIWGKSIREVLHDMQCEPDFTADANLNWIHRQAGDCDVYFIANPTDMAVEARCTFRVQQKRPELWNPESGEIASVAMYEATPDGIAMSVRLEASESAFVVFRPQGASFDAGVRLTHDGRRVPQNRSQPHINIEEATYGAPGDASRTRDVRDELRALLDRGETRFYVHQLAREIDPARGIVKTFTVKYSVDGATMALQAQDLHPVDLHPSLVFTTGPEGDAGLKGEYFANRELHGAPSAVRVDSRINFSWGGAPPAPEVPATNWSARWTGSLTPRESADYTFDLQADDGCRLTINGTVIIDRWEPGDGALSHTGKISLEAGESYDVCIEYFQQEGDSSIQFYWWAPPKHRPAEVRQDAGGHLEVVATQPGDYELTTASGKTLRAKIAQVPAPQEIGGPWEVNFPEGWGAPRSILMPQLKSLSESEDSGVKYFSGTATYHSEFPWKSTRGADREKTEVLLDLGEVQVMAHVVLNNHDLGVFWKPPFLVDVTNALKTGQNTLEVRVANLWPNRMIGDHVLGAEKRFTWSSYDPFNADSRLPRSGLIGPIQIRTRVTSPLQ